MAGYLRRMTFFVLDGKSTQDVMEERGWVPNQFENESAWKDAVVRWSCGCIFHCAIVNNMSANIYCKYLFLGNV
jgi:hypothetical protein